MRTIFHEHFIETIPSSRNTDGRKHKHMREHTQRLTLGSVTPLVFQP